MAAILPDPAYPVPFFDSAYLDPDYLDPADLCPGTFFALFLLLQEWQTAIRTPKHRPKLRKSEKNAGRCKFFLALFFFGFSKIGF